ncbi:hypothetical protein C0995_007489 [Termitomyces sp. Mi166|nr:hypothetical protein C0995_007489 [Termitomyces sp. Mi166\
MQSSPGPAAGNGPSTTTWRRERLIGIGGSGTTNNAGVPGPDSPPDDNIFEPSIAESPIESTSLSFSRTSYGTLPTSRPRATNLSIARRATPQPSRLSFSSLKRPSSIPTAPSSPSLRDLALSRLSLQRPISSYDAPLQPKDEADADAKVNGIRVWYSSFSSIDWLHDAIKDSARFSRLRKRKSLRSRVRLAIDKSLGWFVVTIVGFFSAVVAFLVVRSEQWLFDVKEGYCYGAWWKAKRFCCPALNDFVVGPRGEDTCQRWRSWVEVISPETNGFFSELTEYTVFACIALSLALISTLLTIYLTNSTTFVTRKESGVLSPDFPGTAANLKDQTSNAKRRVMYYDLLYMDISADVFYSLSQSVLPFPLHLVSPLEKKDLLCTSRAALVIFKYENNEAKRREILSAACAAGVAVAFGAPIGGTLFSLEEVSYFFPSKITVITTGLCFINPFTRMSGTELVYSLFAECQEGYSSQHAGLCTVNPRTFWGIWSVIREVLVAMIIKACLTIVTFGIKVPAGIFIPSLGVGACAGRVLGLVIQWLQYQELGAKIFPNCAKDRDCIIPGLYAMVGAAATLSGVTRTTVSLAVIMFELTDTLNYVIPVMLSVLVAKTVADALEPKGIYDLVIELNQLPYLDSKHEYLWGNLQINDVTARDVGVIRLDGKNTVTTLRDQLVTLMQTGNDDSGFPILRPDSNDNGMRMVGYIGASELEYALSLFHVSKLPAIRIDLLPIGLVADEAEVEVHFHTTYTHFNAAASISSLIEESEHQEQDLFDFSVYMDQAPLTVQSNSPLEIVHQFFSKLGARYVVITDTEGLYEGVIDKKTWVAFLADLEEKS